VLVLGHTNASFLKDVFVFFFFYIKTFVYNFISSILHGSAVS